MAGLFSRPKPPPMPRVPAPPPIPQPGDEAADAAMKRARQRGGFRKTIITGELAPAGKGLKTVLGGG